MKIAFLGLGMMGLPMASRLVAAGHEVAGYDPAAVAAAAFAAAGGRSAASAAAAAAGCELLITMLPTGALVRAALLDAPALADTLPRGTVVVDMSSSDPTGTQALARDLQERGLQFLDAPVSGGVARARAGTLALMVGGDPAVIEAVRPVLSAMGSSIFATGPIGSGHAMKALNNYVSAAGLAAACEAVRIGARFGLDPAAMVDVLNASTGRNNSTEVKLKPFVLSGSYASGFSLALMAKDLNTADALARHLQVPAPLSHAVAALWQSAHEALGPGADHTEIDRYLGSLDA